MKREQNYSSMYLATYKILAYFCTFSFLLSTVVFLCLFFYPSLKISYESFTKGSMNAPIYEKPNISIPSIENSNEQKNTGLESKPTVNTPISFQEDLSQKDAERIFVAYELGDTGLVSRLIVDFLSEYPDSIYRHKVRLIGANLMNKRGDFEGALNYIQKILGEPNLSNMDYSESVLLLGEIARERKQFDSYIQSFLEQAYFRSEEPTKSKLSFYLGYLLLHKGDFQSSLRYFNNVIGEDGVLGKSDLYAAQQMRPERINELENFIKAYPSSKNFDYVTNAFVTDIMKHGEELSVRGYLDSSERLYKKIVKYFPDTLNSDEAILKIADLYYQRQNISKSMEILQQVLQNSDTRRDPDALFSLGKLAFELNKQEEALGYLRILTEKYPDYQYISKVREWQNLLFESLRN